MRHWLATAQLSSVVVLLAVGLFAESARAERKIFIISSKADGYGVDRCLADGEKCGAPIANAYCRSHQFANAASYRKVDRDEITGSIPSGPADGCIGGSCDIVAIVCQR